MKIKNILFSLFVIIGTLFTTTVKAATTAPSSFVINASDTYLLYGSDILGHGSTLNFTYKVNADGKIVYCTEIHDSMTSTSEKYTYSKEMDAKIAYVLEHGYPNVSITGNKSKDYYITGVALWYLLAPNDSSFYHFDLAKGTYKGYSSDVVREVAKLVNGAKAYSYTNPTIKINTANNNLKLSSDGKYYVSSSMGVKTTGSIDNKTYTVSLESAPSGTIVTDVNGKEKTTFKTSETFLVKVPATSIKNLSAEFKVNISATGSINKAYLYIPGNSAHQNLTALYPEKKDIKDSTTLKLSIITEVEISKTDAATGKELPGAKLTVKDANGKVVDSWESTNEPHVIKGLKPGKYSLTEEIAPEGYIKSEETIEFEIKADASVTKVVMENKREEKTPVPVYISKQDATTGEELPGAHLELKDEKGNLIEAWVSGDEPHEVEELKPGKYYLSETLAPEGYELTTEVVEFTVKEDGTVDGKVIMYNKPETYIPVPSTSSFKTITASLIGIIVIGLGSVIIYRNYKKNEEN